MMKQLLEVFLIFCRVSTTAFGGGYTVLPLLQKELVDQRGWLTEAELADDYALAQCLPGLIITNMAVLIVRPRLGRTACFAACLGVLLSSLLIILLIAVLLGNFAHLPMVQHALAGIRCAVAALVVWTAWRLVKSGVRDLAAACLFVAALVLLLLDWLSPILIILGAAVAGLLLGRWRERRAKR